VSKEEIRMECLRQAAITCSGLTHKAVLEAADEYYRFVMRDRSPHPPRNEVVWSVPAKFCA
jgi:hypothetical protein